MDDNDIQIIDTENFRTYGSKGEDFSRSGLVMGTMKKCRDNGMVEMKEGYTTIKKDKFGNELPIYIPDTRLIFIESIETFKMIMGEDIDDNTQNKINAVEDKLKEVLNNYLQSQANEWTTAHPAVILNWKKNGLFPNKDKLSQGFSYYNDFLIDKVKLYREIYVILGKRSKELNYWKEESYEA